MTGATPRPRQFNRSVLRAHVDELRWRGLFDAVRAQVSPEVQALLDRPRDAPQWLGGACFDELNAAIYGIGGRQGLRDFLAAVMQTGLVKVLEPLISFALNFVGSGPSAIFSRTDLMLSVNTRNVDMKWEALSDTSGAVTVMCGEKVPVLTWIAWEGVFSYIFTLCGVTGTVDEAVAAPDGCSARIEVRWTPR